MTPEQRAKIKAMNYGLAYGLSAFGLSNQLRISVEEARGLMDDYFKEFGGVRDYLQSIVAQARLDGYTSTIMGRRRYLPDLTSDNRQRREMAERMALNAPIQGSAADVIKVAMLRVSAALKSAGLKSRMLLQVHDELIFEAAPGELDALTSLVKTEMGGADRLRVPLEVSTGTGRSWAEAAHYARYRAAGTGRAYQLPWPRLCRLGVRRASSRAGVARAPREATEGRTLP